MAKPDTETLCQRLHLLGLHGLLARFDEVRGEPWLVRLIEDEEAERARRSLERRIKRSKIGRFKPMADFDWTWPTRIDREAIEDLLTLSFISEFHQARVFALREDSRLVESHKS
jgi:hypothetical protein